MTFLGRYTKTVVCGSKRVAQTVANTFSRPQSQSKRMPVSSSALDEYHRETPDSRSAKVSRPDHANNPQTERGRNSSVLTSSSFGLQSLSTALPEIENSRSLSSLIPASAEPRPIPTTTSDSSSTPVDNTESSSAEATHREPSTTSNGETSDPVAVQQDHASTSGPLDDAYSTAARARRLRRSNQTALREPLQHSHKRREDKIPPAVRNAGLVARPKGKRKSIQGRHHQVTASLSGLENVPSSKKGKNGRGVTIPSSATSSSPYSRRRERVFIARFSEEVVSCENTTFATSTDEIFCPTPVRLRRPLLPVDLPPETFGRKSPPPRPSTPYPRRSVSRPRPSTPDSPGSIPSVSTSNTRSVTDIPPPPPPIPSSSSLLLQPEYAPETSYSESLQRSSASVSQPLPHTSKSPSNISVQHHVSTPNITSAPTNDFSMDVESDLYSHTASSTSVFAESFNPSHPPFSNAKPFPFQIAHSRPLRRQKTLAKTHLLTHQQVDLTSFTRHRRRLLLSIGPGKYLKNGAEGRVRRIKCSARRFSVQECRSFNSGMSQLVKPPSWLRNEAPYTGLLWWTIRRRYLVCVTPERQALLTTSHLSIPTSCIIPYYPQLQMNWNAHSSTDLGDTMDICLDDEGAEDTEMDLVSEQTIDTVHLLGQSSETNVFKNTWSATSWPTMPALEPSSWDAPVLDQVSTMQMTSAGLEPPSLLIPQQVVRPESPPPAKAPSTTTSNSTPLDDDGLESFESFEASRSMPLPAVVVEFVDTSDAPKSPVPEPSNTSSTKPEPEPAEPVEVPTEPNTPVAASAQLPNSDSGSPNYLHTSLDSKAAVDFLDALGLMPPSSSESVDKPEQSSSDSLESELQSTKLPTLLVDLSI